MSELEPQHSAELSQSRPMDELWQEAFSEWTAASSVVIVGQLRQCRAAGLIRRTYGSGAIKHFAADLRVSDSKVYAYARVWGVFGEKIENGELSTRLESGTLTITHLIACTYAPDPFAALDEAEDEGLSERAIEARARERKEELAIEEAKQSGQTVEEESPHTQNGEPEGASVSLHINAIVCPHCGEIVELPTGEEEDQQ